MSIDLPPQAETDSDNGIVLDDRLTDLLDIPSPIQLPPEIETISKDLLLALTGDQPDPQIPKFYGLNTPCYLKISIRCSMNHYDLSYKFLLHFIKQ